LFADRQAETQGCATQDSEEGEIEQRKRREKEYQNPGDPMPVSG
jgi:hypothetical protein